MSGPYALYDLLRIKRAALQRGFTIHRLAAAAQVQPAELMELFGGGPMDTDALRRLGDALELRPDQMIRDRRLMP